MNDFPCPHCIVEALVKGMLEHDFDPKDIARLVMDGLKDGLKDVEGVTIMTNEDMANDQDMVH